MRFCVLATLLFIFSPAILNGQDLDSLFRNESIPPGLSISYERNAGTMWAGHIPTVAYVTFSTKSDTLSYNVIDHQLVESQAFKDERLNWLLSTSCQFVPHRNRNKNFISFAKGNYYFVAPYCTCTTARDRSCARLAAKINKWVATRK